MKPRGLGCFPVIAIAAILMAFIGCDFDYTGMLGDHTVVDPNPPVNPVEAPEFRLLIVEETGDRPKLPASQAAIFSSVPLRQYLDSHCVKLSDGSNGYRIIDKDDVENLPPSFRETAHLPRDATPWLYCTDGVNGLSCALPKSVDELLAKIKPYSERQ